MTDTPRATHQYEHANPPDPMSEPCSRFFNASLDNDALIAAVWGMVRYIDDIGHRIHSARHQLAEAPEEREKWQAVLAGPGHARQELELIEPELLRMYFALAVNSYLTYLTDIATLVLTEHPSLVPVSEQHLTLDEVAERLSFLSLKRLTKHVRTRYGIRLFDSSDDYERVKRVVALRNVVVHNRGIVNSVLLVWVPDYPLSIGQRIALTPGGVLDDTDMLARHAAATDARLTTEYSVTHTIMLSDFHQQRIAR